MPDSSRKRPTIMEPSAPMAIVWTAERLREGGVVSFPTDTVYGLAGSLSHPAALDRIFAIKGRPENKPLPVLLASAAYLRDVAKRVPAPLRLLTERFWPGPLTVVMPARPGFPPEVLGRGVRGEPTVGVRVPDHFLAIEIIERAGGAIAVTSANRSGEPPAHTAADVAAVLGAEIDILLDGGRSPVGRPSTVIACEGDAIHILREGAIDRATLDAAWCEALAEARS